MQWPEGKLFHPARVVVITCSAIQLAFAGGFIVQQAQGRGGHPLPLVVAIALIFIASAGLLVQRRRFNPRFRPIVISFNAVAMIAAALAIVVVLVLAAEKGLINPVGRVMGFLLLTATCFANMIGVGHLPISRSQAGY